MDLTTQITEAINGWLQGLVAQLLGPALATAGQLVFSTPAFDGIPEIAATWSLVRGIADALFVVAFIAIGIAVMVHGGSDTRYQAKVLVPRLGLAALLANMSLTLCGAFIRLNNAIVDALVGGSGTTPFGDLAGIVRAGVVPSQITGVFIGLAAATMALLLVALYIGRDVVLLLAIVLAPLALASSAFPPTAELARLWARLFGALLFVQVIQAVLVAVVVELLRHLDWLGGSGSELTSGLVLVTVLYVLLQLPFVAVRWAFQQPASWTAPLRTTVVAARRATAA